MDNTDYSFLAQYLPAKYIAPITGFLILLAIIGRVYHAYQGGASLAGILASIFKGINVPTAKESVSATVNNPNPIVPLQVPVDTKSAPPAGSLVSTLTPATTVPTVKTP